MGICPYSVNDRYFYVPFFSGLPVQTRCIMHESMHIIFRHNYEKYLLEAGVNSQGIMEITESLTALLNTEFKEFLLMPEFNKKPTAKDLQVEVARLYDNEVPFNKILDKLIEMRIK